MKQRKTIQRYNIISNATATRWGLLRLVALLAILLVVMPAQAATDYTFSPTGLLPVGCSLNLSSTTSYTCSTVTLVDGDTIAVGLITPVTVTLTGALTTVSGNLINAAGVNSDMNIVTHGALTLGDNTFLNANVTAFGVMDIMAGSRIGGSVINTANGVITIGANITIGGSVEAVDGAINIGDSTTACGSVIITGGGVATLTTNVKIGGNIETAAGAITVGNLSAINGDITTSGSGVVTLTDVLVDGKVESYYGGITLTDSRIGGTVMSTGGGVVIITNSLTEDPMLDVQQALGCGDLTEPDHFVISHDTSGIHCAAETVSVTAKNAYGTTLTSYTGTVTLDTQTGNGSWSLSSGSGTLTDATANDGLATYNYDAADNGVATFALNYTEGTAIFNIDAYDGAMRDDDSEGDITFAANGFTLTASALSNPPPNPVNDPIGTQTAGTAFNLYLAAYGTTPTDSQCGIIETYTGSRNLTLTTNFVDPSSGTVSASGGGSTTFSNGQALINTKYKDAGQIQLSVSDGSINGGTNNFVVKPASLNIALSGSNQTAADPNGTVYTSAGSDFTVTVTAQDSEGSTTFNFGNESTPETIALVHALAQPAGGASGALNGSLSKTGSGLFSSTFNYSEVGIINLTADIGDDDFLGTGNISNTLNDIGRFTPQQFALTGLDAGALEHAIATGFFSYTGQSFGFSTTPNFTITAQNALGATTTNYTGLFGKLGASSVSVPAIIVDGTQNGSDGSNAMAIVHNQTAISHSDSGAGLHAYVLGSDTFTYTRNTNSLIGAFDSDIAISILSVTDFDGINSNFNSGNILSPTSTNIRYARILMPSVYGPETSAGELTAIPFTVQYWDGSNFVTHTIDSESSFGASTTMNNVSVSGHTDNLSAGELLDSDINFPLSVANVVLGIGDGISVNRPGVGNDGSVNITFDVDDWLTFDWNGSGDQNPTTTIHFGYYRGQDRVIYWREVH
jgi:hypothetical protein